MMFRLHQTKGDDPRWERVAAVNVRCIDNDYSIKPDTGLPSGKNLATQSILSLHPLPLFFFQTVVGRARNTSVRLLLLYIFSLESISIYFFFFIPP